MTTTVAEPVYTISIEELPRLDAAVPCQLVWRRASTGLDAECGKPAAARVRTRCLRCDQHNIFFACSMCLELLKAGKVRHSLDCYDRPVIVGML